MHPDTNLHAPPTGQRGEFASAAAESLGIASVAIGGLGLLLFFLPILGIPLAGVGVVLGVVAGIFSLGGTRVGMRWPIAGILVGMIAFVADIAIVAWAYCP